MAPDDGFLKNTKLGGDELESGKQNRTAQNPVRGRRGGNGGGSAGTEAEGFVRTADLAREEIPRMASGTLETAKMETLKRTDTN